MPCYHPMTAYRSRSGRDPLTGKWPIVFNVKEGYIDHEVTVPCGKCIGCRLERSRQWAIRCVHEASLHDFNSFITLTYNEEHIDKQCGIYDEEINGIRQHSLNKRDFVLFMKKLRKAVQKDYGKQIRFFHCGEYGEECKICQKSRRDCTCSLFTPDLGRPHHHACIFGFEFPDRECWTTRGKVPLYRSAYLESLWGYGYCIVGDVTFESAAYVARYVTKKISGDKASDHYDGREPEYITMSRGGRSGKGIGGTWFEKYRRDVTSIDKVVIRNSLICRPPKYYDNLYDKLNPKQMEVVKRRRLKLVNAANNTPERLAVREELQKLKAFKLKRHLEA